MKIDEYELFLNKFKSIELLIPKLPEAPIDANMKWLEDNVIENLEDKNKLYLCRVTRNYIQHNTGYKDFVSINKGMLDFLDKIQLFIKGKLVTIKNLIIPLKKMPKCTEEDKVISVLELMNKKKLIILPIIKDNKIIKVIDIFSLTTYYINSRSKTKKIKDFIETNKGTKFGFIYLKDDLLMEDVLPVLKDSYISSIYTIFITDSGTEKGNLIGMLNVDSIKK